MAMIRLATNGTCPSWPGRRCAWLTARPATATLRVVDAVTGESLPPQNGASRRARRR